ncbi:MAG: WbqC family protein [Nitrospiria bacterium]
MRVAIHQPQYLPWLGYFDKVDQVDLFVMLDNVQFKKNEWQNRNRIKTAQGWQWMTVPVFHQYPEKIGDIRINNQVDWKRKHLHAVQTNYNRSPYFRDYYPFFEDLYKKEWPALSVLNCNIIEYLMGILGIKRKILLSSQMKLRDGPTERLIDICRAVGADTYLTGKGGENYLDLDRFEEANINVELQSFEHPVYPQLYGPFEPALSVIDLLFNCGPQSLDILRQGRSC